MTVEEIIETFKYVPYGTFPREALSEAVARQKKITPVLLEYIAQTP